MQIDVYELMVDNPLLVIFITIGIGCWIGNLKIAKVEVGSTTGVLLAGLALGHFGLSLGPGAATFGFALFIFSVGLQAGPIFLSAFLEDGRKYIALSAVVAATALGLAFGLSRLVALDPGLDAGMLAGALTSTPTLAGAEDAIRSGLATLPDGLTPEQAMRNVSVGYAITYIFGTVGLIVFIRYFPTLARIDLPGEALKLAREKGMLGRRRVAAGAERLPIIRAYEIGEQAVGKTIEQRRLELEKRVTALRVKRGHEYLDPDPSLELQKGDIVSIIASLDAHLTAQEQIGQEVLDARLLNFEIISRDIVVTNPRVAGKPLEELAVTSEYGCYATGLMRASVELPLNNNTIIKRGDRLQVSGEEAHLRSLAERLGHIEEEVEKTDLLTFAFGIGAGVLLGLVVFKIGGISIGLGSAGGLLIVGILVGFLSSIHPTFGRVPGAARSLLMDFGLMLFMAGVGLKAGGGIAEALVSVGPAMIACGVAVTLTPVLVGYAVGRYVLKLNPAILLGSITGAMTSTPSLSIVTTAARSPVPALGYAGTYTFANVLLTFAGTLIMML